MDDDDDNEWMTIWSLEERQRERGRPIWRAFIVVASKCSLI